MKTNVYVILGVLCGISIIAVATNAVPQQKPESKPKYNQNGQNPFANQRSYSRNQSGMYVGQDGIRELGDKVDWLYSELSQSKAGLPRKSTHTIKREVDALSSRLTQIEKRLAELENKK